ncbi:class I mannose-6-phosphate isomerase [Qipengyuania sp.]|uniref:class I mannose-6-phosphate isomerase n=1 Tax=Qipengyuania sp. TaxID=2004515 RepID=UPI003AF5B63F
MTEKLSRKFVQKVWGVDRLPPEFGAGHEARIGEVWFKPPAQLPELLAKYIFTSERLSVQNHPNDDLARALRLGPSGKSECWIILDSEADAEIAVGFTREVAIEDARKAALDGSIVELLAWHKVSQGDVFYIPPGTVHAIGGGVNLVEIQQNSDITFRLYDYGRPRPLHLDEALEAAVTTPYPPHLRSRLEDSGPVLVEGEHFTLFCIRADETPTMDACGPALALPLTGEPSVDGGILALGECVLLENVADARFSGSGIVLLAQPTPR